MAIYNKIKDCRPLGQPLPTINYNSFRRIYPLRPSKGSLHARAKGLCTLEQRGFARSSGIGTLARVGQAHSPVSRPLIRSNRDPRARRLEPLEQYCSKSSSREGGVPRAGNTVFPERGMHPSSSRERCLQPFSQKDSLLEYG